MSSPVSEDHELDSSSEEVIDFSYLLEATRASFSGEYMVQPTIPILDKLVALDHRHGDGTFLGLPRLEQLTLYKCQVTLPPMPELTSLVVIECFPPVNLLSTPKLRQLEILGSHVITCGLPLLERLSIDKSSVYGASIGGWTLSLFPELRELSIGHVDMLTALPWYPKLEKLTLARPLLSNGYQVETLAEYRRAWA